MRRGGGSEDQRDRRRAQFHRVRLSALESLCQTKSKSQVRAKDKSEFEKDKEALMG